MNVPNWVIKSRYNPNLIKLAKLFHIHKFIEKRFYRITLPSDKKIKILLFGYQAQFYAHTPDELGFIENVLVDKREGEIRVLQRILEVLQQGDVVYDIGANIGTHSIFMAKKIGEKGRVVAFEPDDHNFNNLQKNIDLNKLNNVILIKFALGNADGDGLLHIAGPESSLICQPSHNPFCQKVKIVPGDFLVLNKNLPLPKAVKIDTEGYEYYVIQGLEKTLNQDKCRMVFCEIHPTKLPQDITPNDIINLLKSYGFNKLETYLRGLTLHAFFTKMS